MRNRNRGPIQMFAKFDSTCAETGAAIKKGDSIVYADGKAYCEASKTAESFRAQQFAAAYNMADANY